MENLTVRERYVDGIGKIHFIGGQIRLDLYSFNPPVDDNKDSQPEPVIAERLIMSPNGFLASYDAFVHMIDKLTEAGVLAKKEEPKQVQQNVTDTPVITPVETEKTEK